MNSKDNEALDALMTKIRGLRLNAPIPSLPGKGCIPEEDLENYLDHSLPQKNIEAVESHLACCTVCFSRLGILMGMRDGEEICVPDRLINRARDLVQVENPNCLELILVFAKDTINIIRNSGILLSSDPVPEPVRGKEEAGVKRETDYVAVKKCFGDIAVDVHIERVNGSYKLMVNSLDTNTGQPPANMRLALFSMDRELNSVDNSEAVFYIKLKNYIVKIIYSDNEIGNIRLDLRKDE